MRESSTSLNSSGPGTPTVEFDVADHLSCTRTEMYRALELFHSIVKHTLSIQFTVMAATSIVLSFGLNMAKSDASNAATNTALDLTDLPNEISILAGVILILLGPFSVVSTIIMSHYYKLYVAAAMFAAQAHDQFGKVPHPWFFMLKGRGYTQGLSEKELDAVLRQRTYRFPHSWSLYALVVIGIGICAVAGGVLILRS